MSRKPNTGLRLVNGRGATRSRAVLPSLAGRSASFRVIGDHPPRIHRAGLDTCPDAANATRGQKRERGLIVAGEFLKRTALPDPQTCLPTLAWAWTSPCPVCGDPIENILMKMPTENFLHELSFMPCEECIEKTNQKGLIRSGRTSQKIKFPRGQERK